MLLALALSTARAAEAGPPETSPALRSALATRARLAAPASALERSVAPGALAVSGRF